MADSSGLKPPPGEMAGESDEALLARVAGADKAAFAALFGRYGGRVKAFLLRLGAAPDMAEEAAQEVMVTLWRKAGAYDPRKAAASTWIFTIARNRHIDLIRRARRPVPDPADPTWQPDPEPDGARTMAGRERDARVRAAMAGLGRDQVEVVRLAFFSDLSHGEIAARLDVPLGTVKSRLRLAFKKLRTELGMDFAGELRDE